MQSIVLGEVFVDEPEEGISNVGLYFVVVWRVEPGYLAFSASFMGMGFSVVVGSFFKLYFFLVAAFL